MKQLLRDVLLSLKTEIETRQEYLTRLTDLENQSDINSNVPRIDKAMEVIERYGTIDGGHHKMWVIDQVVRYLVPDYDEWVKEMKAGEDGPETYYWDIGVAP